jgi:xylulokinase
MMILLGLDLGTSGVKAIALTSEGKALATGYASFPSRVHGAEFEQDPHDWWEAVLLALADLAGSAGRPILAEVGAVGLSGQTHGLVLTDDSGEPVRPVMTWADHRAAAESAELRQRLDGTFVDRTGNHPMEAFTAPKLLWVARHEPEILAATRRFFLPKDWLRWRLTGEWATDPSDASSTLFFDLSTQIWDEELIEASGGNAALFPGILPSGSVAGRISREVARATGLPAGTPVAVGGSDVACAALGAGMVDAGATYVNVGTACQVLTATDAPRPGGYYVFQHVVPGRFLAMGSLFAAGLSLRWFAERFAAEERETAKRESVSVYGILDRLAAAVPPGADGLMYLPYLDGGSIPHPDANARGAFIGLSPHHGAPEVVRAILEGVGFGIADILVSFRRAGLPLTDVRLGGGAADSELWTSILANILGMRLSVLERASSPVAAAILAGVAAGEFLDFPHGVDACVRLATRLEPDPALSSFYREGFLLYSGLYDRLAPVFHDLRALRWSS